MALQVIPKILPSSFCAAKTASKASAVTRNLLKKSASPTILNIKKNTCEPIAFTTVQNLLDGQKGFVLEAHNIRKELIGMAQIIPGVFRGMHRRIAPWLESPAESLYVYFWATSPKYKGIGSEMLKKIVQLSKKLGMKGNVDLEALTAGVPFSYMSICGEHKTQKAAALAYRKMGFSASNNSIINNSILDKLIKEKASGFNAENIEIFKGPMYLTKEAIDKIHATNLLA